MSDIELETVLEAPHSTGAVCYLCTEIKPITIYTSVMYAKESQAMPNMGIIRAL